MSQISNFERIGLSYADLSGEADIWSGPDLSFREETVFDMSYGVYAGPSGEELWIGGDDQGAMLTANPMFTRGGLFKAKLDTMLEGTPPYSFLEGDVQLSILDEGETVTRMQVLLISLGSHRLVRTKGWFGREKQSAEPETRLEGQELTLRIAIFADHIEHFATEEDFYASPAASFESAEEDMDASEDAEDTDFRLASTSFLPHGLFPDAEGQTYPVGSGTGPVLACGTAASAFGGPDFHWATVQAIGGVLGVVWAPQDGAPATVGSFMSYSGMLIAKLETGF